ncbi:MAG TPA: GNAT family N-acetyltransferase [Candidatus Binatia bacterium]
MKIRLLDCNDAQIFRSIRLEAVHDTPMAFAESVAEAKGRSLADFENYLDSHNRGDFVLGAFDERDALVGVVGFYREAHVQYFHKGVIWGMYVKPAFRRRGVGAALLSAAIERTRTLAGIRRVNLAVTSPNGAAKRLYERLGFRVYGIEPAA